MDRIGAERHLEEGGESRGMDGVGHQGTCSAPAVHVCGIGEGEGEYHHCFGCANKLNIHNRNKMNTATFIMLLKATRTELCYSFLSPFDPLHEQWCRTGALGEQMFAA